MILPQTMTNNIFTNSNSIQYLVSMVHITANESIQGRSLWALPRAILTIQGLARGKGLPVPSVPSFLAQRRILWDSNTVSSLTCDPSFIFTSALSQDTIKPHESAIPSSIQYKADSECAFALLLHTYYSPSATSFLCACQPQQ